ncbi:MAG: lipase family protein [Marmoricola sp.]
MSSSRRFPSALLGLVLAGLGATLATRPFTTVAVLAALTIAASAFLAVTALVANPRPWTASVRFTTAVWVVAAVAVAARPGIDIGPLAVTVGLALVFDGMASMYAAFTDDDVRRLAGFLLGAAAAALGVQALVRRDDATVLLVAVVLGVKVLWFGLTVLWTAVRPVPSDQTVPVDSVGALRRSSTVAVSLLALLLAGGLGGFIALQKDDGTSATYRLPGKNVPKQPGRLISAEPFNLGVPTGSHAWRITYTTTLDAGKPAVASALVLVKGNPKDRLRPVIAWAHGTTGYAEGCAPSGPDDSIRFISIPSLDAALENGWAIVATDYTGLGTPGPQPYLIGQGEGRAVLDSVRAAREFDQLRLQRSTVVWGHSQGGGAALWAGVLAKSYAPGLKVAGVVGIAPASDMPGLVGNISRLPGGEVFASYVMAAYSATYPDVKVNSYVKAAARKPLRRLAELCLSDQQGLQQALLAYDFDRGYLRRDPLTGPLGRRLRENVPTGKITAPVFIAQGLNDKLVLPAVQDAYVADRCKAPGNGPLLYKTYAGRGHGDIVSPGSGMLPTLLAWTAARFDGTDAPTSC